MQRRPIVFDLDGTLCDSSRRLKYITSSPRNWDAFYQEARFDPPIPQTVLIYQALQDDPQNAMLIVTSRVIGLCKADTDAWLEEQQIWYDKIYFRQNGDFRKDVLVKLDIIKQIEQDYGQAPFMVFEDRRSVITEAYRASGVFTIDVNQSQEDIWDGKEAEILQRARDNIS